MATLGASQALFEHVRLVQPGFPSEQQRRADFDHHVALKQLIDRASRAFADR